MEMYETMEDSVEDRNLVKAATAPFEDLYRAITAFQC